MKTTPESQSLISEIEKFELWLASEPECAEGKKDDYSRWPELSTAFISFLRTKQNSNWTDSDQELVARACHNDWQHHKLFKTIDASERVAFMLLPFSDIGARMHMLVCARDNKTIKMEVAHYFFENDPHEAIRETALITLAAGKWPEAEGHALKLWKTRKTVQRMVALDCLEALKSPLLDEYIEKALKSNNNHVRRHASAIFSVKNIDKMNWPKPFKNLPSKSD